MFVDHGLGFIDPLGNLDTAGTYPGTLEVILAGPHAVRVIQNIQSVLKTGIPGIKDKPGSLYYCRRSDEIGVLLQNRAS